MIIITDQSQSVRQTTLRRVITVETVERLKQVIVAPDLTRKEREKNDKLREELKHRRQTGGRWIIRKGKVIKLHNGDEERVN